ncbi:MAG: heme utilization cystosolic carrier protein HutX [Desulfovibrionaceae bacterium]
MHDNTLLKTEIQARIIKNPSEHTMNLAEEFGVSEAEVVRCLPDEMRTEAPASDFETLWNTMTKWDKVTFICRNAGAVVEVVGKLPQGNFGHGFFNLNDKDSALRGHLFADRVGSIWLVSKPFFTMESHSVQFFDIDGNAMFSVYLGRDAKRQILESVRTDFLALRERYATGRAA